LIRHTLWAGWWALVLGMVLALLLTAVRFGFPLVGQYRDSIAQLLSERVGVPISIEQLSTEWNGPFPSVDIQGLEALSLSDFGPDARFRFDSLHLELNWWESLLLRAPIFRKVEAQGLYIRWYQREASWLHLPGEGSSAGAVDMDALATVLNVVMAQPEFRISNSELELVPEYGPNLTIDLGELLFENSAKEHQLSGDLRIPLLGEDTAIHFAARLEGDLSHPSTLEVPFFFEVDRLGTELLQLTPSPVPVTDLSASAQIWGNLNQFGLEYLRGELGVDRAWIDLPDSALQLGDSHTEFSLRPNSEGYQIQLRNTRIGDALGQLELAPSQLELHRVAGQLGLSRVLLREIDLALLDELLARYPLPEKIAEILIALAPTGQMQDLRIDLNDQRRGPLFRARLHNVSLDSWRGNPEVRGLNADLELDAKSGRLAIDSNNVELGFPTAYTDRLELNAASGELYWQIGDVSTTLSSGVLELEHPLFSATGRFGIELPRDPQEQAFLDLMIGLKQAKLGASSTLIPNKIVSPALTAWLEQALQAGTVEQAGLVVRAATRKLDDRPKPKVELFVAAQGVELDYQSPWPPISGADTFIHLRDGAVRVDVEKGEVLDSELGRSVVVKQADDNRLRVGARVSGDLQQIDQLFHTAPLDQVVGKTLGDWQLAGEHSSLLELDIALDRSRQPSVRVKADLRSGIFASEVQRLALTDIDGTLAFDSASGLQAKGLKANFLGRAASVDLSSKASQGTEVKFSGKWPAERLLEWARIPLNRFVAGDLPIHGRLNLCAAGACVSSLQLESNLAGTVVSGPEFLTVAAAETGRLSVDLQLSDPLSLVVNFNDQLRTAMRLGDNPAGHFTLGGEAPRLPQQGGYKISGEVEELALNEVFETVSSISQSFGGTSSSAAPNIAVDLGVQTLTLGSLYLKQVGAELNRLGQEWQLSLSGPDAGGLVSWSSAQPTYRAALNKLHLNKPETESTQVSEVEPEPTDRSIFEAVPAVDFDVADLRWNAAKLGRWRASLRPAQGSVELNSIRGEMQDVELNGSASWIMTDRELTRVNLAYTGRDLGKTLESLGETRLIETDSLEGRVALAWEAAPWQVASERMYGNFRFAAGKGRLLETSGGSGLLRLFGILNFNTLVRRLQLDFKDLFAKGLVFDSLEGNFLLEEGVARSVVPLTMKGPSAGMLAEGAVDLGEKTLDMQVNVTLPLISNTPLAAVLLGAPQIAGALFLIDKLIGDEIEKATSIAYTLTGGWDSPELKLLERQSDVK